MLDANVLIALLDRQDALHVRAFDLVEDHAWEAFCASAVTFAETLVRPSRLGLAYAHEASLRSVGVRIVPVSRAIARGVADLCAHERVGVPDATAVVTTQHAEGRLATFDRRLGKLARRHGVDLAEPYDDGGPWPFPT
ncbi:type II toxin-antitoxin system VapC family toxin [Curtobacterium oceanosedimentum]|uniref:type II toxin-antitoxin system VapC family toxin n=1 Tax=Curtobacterium oceanosedimentum TaxID=465820 RepID=UPI001379A046|nr:PIN domain-containing protein [Curtobacterium oceanosedimentum]